MSFAPVAGGPSTISPPTEKPRSADALPAAGRACPVDYHYRPSVFDRPPALEAEVLYVVGGLYGNLAALDAIERLADREQQRPVIIFNGDFHALDAERGWFIEVERQVAAHQAIRGNVETEIARPNDIGAGCGCAYPASVSDAIVRCSNEVIGALRMVALTISGVPERLSTLPMHLVARVGDLRIGIVHGDPTALAGWGFAADALDDATRQPWLADIAAASRIDIFASTHTGLAALRDLLFVSRRLTIINNGTAGLPNFAGSRFGVISRIATCPSPHPPLYGLARNGVHLDALALAYDHAAFMARFLPRWPDGSAGHTSYFSRILAGPTHSTAQAAPPARNPAQ